MTRPPKLAPREPWSVLLDFDGDLRDLGAYEAAGGYSALATSMGMTGAEIIDELNASGLRGRGGAAFPTGRKWSFLAPGEERYVVVNADESEPGTFKDHEIMLRNPHSLIEGVIITCLAVKARQGFIYIRGEYMELAEILNAAVEAARAKGYIGAPLGDTGYVADVVVHRGAGAYICGEETALLSSLNGYRGQPWAKPPFPAVEGAFAKPTILNNVETIADVPWIIRNGGAAYAEYGTEQSRGVRVFSLSGCVKNPGNYELPPDRSFRDLIEGCGGGVPEGRSFKAFVPGGSSTPILLAEQIDTQLSYEGVAAAGSMAGSGAIIVLDDRVSIVEFALRTAEFYRHESCGKCTPCREGTRWLTELLRKFVEGTAELHEIDLVEEVCNRIDGKCLCPLGEACAWPIRAMVQKFRGEFEEAVANHGVVGYDDSPLKSLYPVLKKTLPMVPA